MGDAIKEFLNSKGVPKVIRFLVNEEYCHNQCDFLEDDYCTRFNKKLDSKFYIKRCDECKDLKFDDKIKV